METFSYCVQVGAAGDVSQRVWKNEFGDGYVQSGGTGINGRSESWQITVIGKLLPGSTLTAVRDFLDRHEGYKSFIWTSPSGIQSRWTATGYVLNARGNNVFTLTATFEQAFRP